MRSVVLRVLLALVLFALLQEVALRAVFPLREVLNFDRFSYSLVEEHAEMASFRSLGHSAFSWASDPDGFEFVHRLNLYGFRDNDWPLRGSPGVLRVAFVGDSLVEGFSAVAESAIPEVFERLARERGLRLTTLNLGVGGADLPQYERLVRDSVPLFRPDVVILVLYANDLDSPPRFDPNRFEEAPEPEFANAWEPRLLYVLRHVRSRQPIPRRWTGRPFPYLKAVPDSRNPYSSEAMAIELEARAAPHLADAMKRGRLNPWMASRFPGVRYILARTVYVRPHLRAIDEYVERFGSDLFVVYLPFREQVSDRYLPFAVELSPWGSVGSLMGEEFQRHARHLSQSCVALGIPFLDLTPGLRRVEAGGQAIYWDYDDHLRGRGYRTAAELIFDWWRSTLQLGSTPASGGSQGS
jgi:lysophospholipase L1-like esterase